MTLKNMSTGIVTDTNDTSTAIQHEPVVMTTDAIVTNVVDTNTSTDIIIPFSKGHEHAIKQEVEDLQKRFSEVIAAKYNIDIDQVRDCIPTNITFAETTPVSNKTPKAKQSTKKYDLDNWRDVANIDDLKQFKAAQLKDIISSDGSNKPSGSKTVLINKVWGILHPNEIVKSPPKKKRGRPSGSSNSKSNSTIVNDTDDDDLTTDIMETLLQGATTVTMADGNNVEVIVTKGWVFVMTNDEDPEYEWAGTLNPDGNSYTTCDPPSEITKLYE
jgi:hypothetical protein